LVGGVVEFAGEVGFGLEAAVAADVIDVNAALDEDAGDQKAAVAVGGIFFGAEEGDAEFLHPGFEAGEALEEEFGLGDAVIEYVAFGVVEFRAFGAAAEFAAEVEVLVAVLRERLFERGLIEVSRVVGVRLRAGVDYDFDLVGFEEIEEVFGGVVGVADGLDGGGRRHKRKRRLTQST